jgi:PAS domain S-box-containing protein
MRAVRQFLRSHRLPLIAVALAALHSLLFWSLGPRLPLGLFMAAVLVSAWQGGLGSAVLATVLSTVALGVIGHYQSPVPEDDLVLRLGLFVLVGLIAGYLGQQCRHAIRAVEHVHDLLGGSGIAVVSADAEGRVTALNPLARSLTGWGDADVGGRPLEQVCHIVHGAARRPLSLPPAGTTQELPEATLLVGPTGGETAIEGTIAPARNSAGRTDGVLVVFREAGGRSQAWQDLRRRSDRFRALAGYAPAGLMVLDAEGRCVFCNPAAQAACGCDGDECLGEGWSRHVQPQDRDRIISDWLRAVVSKEAFADEFRVVTGSAVPRWLRVRSAPMLDDGGEVLGHVAALEEVTERRQAEEALANSRRETEEHLQLWAASDTRAQETLRTARAESAQKLCDEVRAARQQVRDAWREELEAVADMHIDARASLHAELSGHREALRTSQDAHQQLQAALAEKDGAAETLRKEMERLGEEAGATREAHDRLEAMLAERSRNEESLRTELDRLAEDAAAVRQSHDRLQALLAEKEQTEASLWQEVARLEREAAEARDARDRNQALLAEKGEAEASLRKDLDRLTDEAATLRQSHEGLQGLLVEKDNNEGALRQELLRITREAEETRQAHDRVQTAVADKEKTEEALRQEVARLQGEAAARQQAEEVHERVRCLLGEKEQAEQSLRREKEFLEGVIDGSPAGIFAHDRDGRCRVWNPALERLLGRPRAEALGRTTAELFPCVNGTPRSEESPPPENGISRDGMAAVSIGRSELLETAHASVRDAAGEVVGGMALVRVLPMAGPGRARDALATAPGGDSPRPRRAPAEHDGADWLAFN